MGFLTKAAILEADDRKYDTVECPEWGGDVRLRSITGLQRDRYEQSIIEQRGNDRRVNLANARAKLIILCAVDEDGQLLFTSEDLSALGRKNAAPLDRIFDVCKQLAGMSDNDVEKLTEDFGAPQSDDATSG
jgi:hypothetical protein